MKGRLIDLALGLNGKQRITLEVDADFREKYDALKSSDIRVEIVNTANREARTQTHTSTCSLTKSPRLKTSAMTK